MDVGSAIIAGAGLSFLGLGAVPPTPELGAMVSDGIKVPTAWWVALFPGLVILGSVLGFNFLGDGEVCAVGASQAVNASNGILFRG